MQTFWAAFLLGKGIRYGTQGNRGKIKELIFELYVDVRCK